MYNYENVYYHNYDRDFMVGLGMSEEIIESVIRQRDYEIVNTLNGLRDQRDLAIRETDWMVIRHRDELESGIETTLDKAGYVSLLEHRQSLRDWPSTPEWYNTPLPSWAE